MKKIMFFVLCLGVCLAIYQTDSWGAEVKGNNNNWTLIASVKKGSVIKIHASGVVDFGCRGGTCRDNATAGVTGNKAGALLDGLKLDLALIKTVGDPYLIYGVFKKTFSTTYSSNYDQGGVWIKVLTKNGSPYIGTQLYYYWAHDKGWNKYGFPINEDVDVYAKAHDGGKGPDGSKGYGDNKGSYTVTIEYVPR